MKVVLSFKIVLHWQAFVVALISLLMLSMNFRRFYQKISSSMELTYRRSATLSSSFGNFMLSVSNAILLNHMFR